MRFFTNLQVDREKINDLNRVIVQEQFYEKLEAIRKINLNFRQPPSITEQASPPEYLSSNASLTQIDSDLVHDCNPKNGMDLARNILFSGYDESKAQFLALEGEAQLTTHVITQIFSKDIIPSCKVSFYFYSKSKQLQQQSKYVKYSEDIKSDSTLDYIFDRNDMISSTVIGDSVLFIDGPLIGGNISTYNLRLVNSLLEKNIMPVFIVKNSDSNLIVDYTPDFNGKYNSDLHWAYNILKPGQRSALFRYTDKVNPLNSKVFCYIKPFNRVTTQRIEFSVPTYVTYESEITRIFDLVYYLILDHGSETNPQISPIALSESYARDILKLINFERLLMSSSLVPIMNETRFGG